MLLDTLSSIRLPGWIAGPVLALCLLMGVPQDAEAQFRDLGYTLEPMVSNVFSADNAAFHDSPLYGGALGLGFGRSFELSGEYLVNTGAEADLSRVDGLEGLVDRSVDVQRYGGRMRVNLSSGQLQPYLTVGTGALRIDPEAADPSRTVYALGGAGLTYGVRNQYRVSVGGEMLSYRYDPVTTFLGTESGFESEERLVRSPSLTASVSLFLGGRSPTEPTVVDQRIQEQFGGGGLIRNTQLFVNPFYGRIEFDDALNFPKDQNLAGVNAGVELGPYVGLRGFYWRATTGDDLLDEFAEGFEGMEMYGGELRLRLNAEFGRGFVPYATLGGGFLNVKGDYEEEIPEGTMAPSNRFFSMAGGGLEVPLTRSLKLSGGLRSLIMSDQNADGMDNGGDLQASLMYNAGIEFRIGGGGDRSPPPPADTPPPRMPEPMADEPEETPPEERVEETIEEEAVALSPRQAQLLAEVDSLRQDLERIRSERAPAPPAVAPTEAPTEQSSVSGRTITIPVPENGELYVRYGDGSSAPVAMSQRGDTVAVPRAAQAGPPAQVSPEAVQRTVENAVAAALRADTTDALSDEAIDRIVQRAVQRALEEQAPTAEQALDAEERQAQQQTIRRMEEDLADLRQRLREQSTDVMQARREAATRPSAPSTQVVTQSPQAEEDRPPFYRQALGRPLTYVVPVTGVRVGEGPNQFQLGVRGDYRRQPSSRLHFMPELAMGFGSGETTVTLLANGAYSFLRNRTPQWTNAPLEPYGGLGLGLKSDGGLSFEFVTNLFLGTDYRFGNGQTGFVELGGLDFFDTTRFTIGYRIRL
jgi:hypothetical protein